MAQGQRLAEVLAAPLVKELAQRPQEATPTALWPPAPFWSCHSLPNFLMPF